MTYNLFREYKQDDTLPPIPEWGKEMIVVNNSPTFEDLKAAIDSNKLLFTFITEPTFVEYPIQFTDHHVLLGKFTEDFMGRNRLFPSPNMVLVYVPYGIDLDKAADIYIRRHFADMPAPGEPIFTAPPSIKFGRFMRKPGR